MRPLPSKSARAAKAKPFAEEPDQVIARITRRSYQLRHARKRRGGVRGARGHQAPEWTLGELKLLGTRPDAEIARSDSKGKTLAGK